LYLAFCCRADFGNDVAAEREPVVRAQPRPDVSLDEALTGLPVRETRLTAADPVRPSSAAQLSMESGR